MQGSMQLQYGLIKQQNPNMADTTIFSTSIYGISVTFADVITSDTPIIIDNNVIAWSLYGCLVLILKLLILAQNSMFGIRRL